MNHAAASCGVSKTFMRIFRRLSPPNVLIGGPVRISPGFPLKTCGNDVRSCKIGSAQAVENKSRRDSAQLDDHSFVGAQVKVVPRIFLVTIDMGGEQQ